MMKKLKVSMTLVIWFLNGRRKFDHSSDVRKIVSKSNAFLLKTARIVVSKF